MTMRDRLAADLCPEFTADRRHARDIADRLIDLGWVRLDEDELTAAKHDYAAKMLAIVREQGAVLVTEEALARALEVVIDGGWYYRDLYKARPQEDAATVLAALREEP